MTYKELYPGMLDNSKEYFEAEGNVFLIANGMVQRFDDVQYHEELELIIETEPKLKQTLQKMVGENGKNQQKQLAKCRFGGLNFSADFSDDSKSTNDYRNCQKRGNCIGENIVCQPFKINGVEVSELEINLLKELATDKKNEAIASDLNLPLGTFNVTKTSLYKKLKIYNKPQSVFILMKEGLL